MKQSNAQVITLPQGGGALKGLGEKFTPDLHTGNGNFSVPLSLPSGRNGFHPELTLSYSSGNGNGLFGLGWSLNIPRISRKTSKGTPRYDNSQDVFILSGAEDLVPIPSAPQGALRYRPRTEGLFALIDHYITADKNIWEVRTKDGHVSVYGTPRPVGAPQSWRDPAAMIDPDNPRHIFAWLLTRTTDPFGNQVVYRYLHDEGPHRWDQIFPDEIEYVDHGDPANPQFLVKVKFTYEQRTDPFSDYRAGFEIRTVKRCSSITVFSQADEVKPIRTFHLEYQTQPGPQSNSISFLHQIRVEGLDGSRSQSQPPLIFGYTAFQPQQANLITVTGPAMPTPSLANPNFELADLFGTGLPDIIEMGESIQYWRNLGGGRFDAPRSMTTAPVGVQLSDRGVLLIDANGDGQLDLLVMNNSQPGYYPLRFHGLWDSQAFKPYTVAPGVNLEEDNVRLLDLDGDGVIDALRTAEKFECYFNDPDVGWQDFLLIDRGSVENFPDVNFQDEHVKLADMTGDGLADIVRVNDQSVEYWPSKGRGSWGRQVIMANSPHLPLGWNPRRVLVGDVDGDGVSDLVFVGNMQVTIWINQNGNRWSDPIVITGTPSVSDVDSVRLTDLLGTGMLGILWSREITGSSEPRFGFLDLANGVKPYLLNAIDNHRGSRTQVEYAPSTRFYLADEIRSATRWKTPLPFPVQVVARIVAEDMFSQGRLTSEYTYHHGYWDGVEREFRGFGRVDQRDTEVLTGRPFYSPPTETRNWFHQGPIGDEFEAWTESDFTSEYFSEDPQVLIRPTAMASALRALSPSDRRDALRTLRGKILRKELYALDGTDHEQRPFTVSEYLTGIREEEPPRAGEQRKRIFFPHALTERVTQWERGHDPMTRFNIIGRYDAFGQPGSQISIAVPRGRDYRLASSTGDPYLITQTQTIFAHPINAMRYIMDRVARTTTYEVREQEQRRGGVFPPLLDLARAIDTGMIQGQVISQTSHYYDGPAFIGLPFGQLGDHGALVRTESLVLTLDLIHEAYRSSGAINEEPPYLTQPAGPAPSWPREYPQSFRDHMPDQAGYVYHADEAEFVSGYFAMIESLSYDVQLSSSGRGLVKAMRDALGRETAILYDNFELFPILLTDPVGLVTRANYDYRALQAAEVIDPNGNRTTFTYTPLGLLETQSVIGKPGSGEGDQTRPFRSLFYDFDAFDRHQQPVHVRTIRYVHHDTETDVSPVERDAIIETREYSDGMGRLLQTRTVAETATFGDQIFGDSGLPVDQRNQDIGQAIGQQWDPESMRVVVSGWQTYDNKGRVVEKYEPFFSNGWEYSAPTNAQLRQKVIFFYDPLVRMIRTVNADGSEQRVVHGVPGRIHAPDLTDPSHFEPTPWETYTYDTNDNAGRTHPSQAAIYRSHWNTPSSIVVDGLGRTVEAIQRNGSNSVSDWLTTRSTYDIRGNLLTVRITEPVQRLVSSYVYDLANRAIRTEQLDSGVTRKVFDATGSQVEQRDSKGALILHAYDRLGRRIRFWARDLVGEPTTLRERLIYGDDPDSGLSANQAITANLLGKLYRHYDEAGLITLESYDCKGNSREKLRQVMRNDVILEVFSSPHPNGEVSAFRVNWEPSVGTSLDTYAARLLDSTLYRTSFQFDALNRIKQTEFPEDVEGVRRLLRPYYNAAGALERVELNGVVFVDRIAYNAKGQRLMVAFGNRVFTRYAYDPHTFRLARLRTERYTISGQLNYHPSGTVLQDLAYEYDLVGNILAIHDKTPGSGLSGMAPNELNRSFTYDALYRLLTATGRECDLPQLPPWGDEPRCTDLSRKRPYTERYVYDMVGNLTRLEHRADGTGFTRLLNPVTGSDRLERLIIDADSYTYVYDLSGNLIQENTTRHFEWDHSNRMRVYRTQTPDSAPTLHTQYLYDAAGRRVKKLVRKGPGLIEATVYIGDLFEHYRIERPSSVQENNTLHLMDGRNRIGLIRVGPAIGDSTIPAITYHLADHLGSSNLGVSDTANWINREEYTPYGETSFGSFAKKRYRFTGKERDEENGLYYHGARYFASWLGRWTSCDPAGSVDGYNPYIYGKNNPIRFGDPSGKQAVQGEHYIALKDTPDYRTFEASVGRLSDPSPPPMTAKERTENHDIFTKEHEDAVKQVINEGLRISTKHFTDPLTSRVTGTKKQIIDYALNNLIVPLREKRLQNSQNLIFRDADHYFTGWRQEWQTSPKTLQPLNWVSQREYERRVENRRANPTISAFLADFSSVIDLGYDALKMAGVNLQTSRMPQSAPGGRHWSAHGTMQFFRDRETMSKTEAPSLLNQTPFEILKAEREALLKRSFWQIFIEQAGAM